MDAAAPAVISLSKMNDMELIQALTDRAGAGLAGTSPSAQIRIADDPVWYARSTMLDRMTKKGRFQTLAIVIAFLREIRFVISLVDEIGRRCRLIQREGTETREAAATGSYQLATDALAALLLDRSQLPALMAALTAPGDKDWTRLASAILQGEYGPLDQDRLKAATGGRISLRRHRIFADWLKQLFVAQVVPAALEARESAGRIISGAAVMTGLTAALQDLTERYVEWITFDRSLGRALPTPVARLLATRTLWCYAVCEQANMPFTLGSMLVADPDCSQWGVVRAETAQGPMATREMAEDIFRAFELRHLRDGTDAVLKKRTMLAILSLSLQIAEAERPAVDVIDSLKQQLRRLPKDEPCPP